MSMDNDDSDFLENRKYQVMYKDGEVALVRPQRSTATMPPEKQKLSCDINDHLRLLYESQKLCDLVITNGEKKLGLHRVVLAAHSEKYNQVFADPNSTPPTEIAVKDVTAHTLEEVLKYMYTGEMILNENNISEVVNVVSQLDLTEMKSQCRGVLMKYTKENALRFLILARKHEYAEVVARLMKYAQLNFPETAASHEFVKLDSDTLAEILANTAIRRGVTGELGVLKAALRWLNAEWPDRRQFAVQVLRCIKFEALSPHDLFETVESNTSLSSIPEVTLMLFDAYRHLAMTYAPNNSQRSN